MQEHELKVSVSLIKSNFCLRRKMFMQVSAFERYIPLEHGAIYILTNKREGLIIIGRAERGSHDNDPLHGSAYSRPAVLKRVCIIVHV